MRELHAELTVACDGRSSTLRNAMGLTPRSFGAPMDVWWFRLPRNADDPHGLAGVLGAGHALHRHRSRRLLPDRLRHPEGPRRRAACAGHRNAAPRGRGPGAVAGRSHHGADVIRRRQAPRRPAQPAATLVHQRAAADRRRRARHVTGGRGRDQPGRRRRGSGRSRTGRPAAPRHRLHPAVGPRAGAAVVARRADSVGRSGSSTRASSRSPFQQVSPPNRPFWCGSPPRCPRCAPRPDMPSRSARCPNMRRSLPGAEANAAGHASTQVDAGAPGSR